MWTAYTHKYFCKKVNLIGNCFTTKNSSPSIAAPVVVTLTKTKKRLREVRSWPNTRPLCAGRTSVLFEWIGELENRKTGRRLRRPSERVFVSIGTCLPLHIMLLGYARRRLESALKANPAVVEAPRGTPTKPRAPLMCTCTAAVYYRRRRRHLHSRRHHFIWQPATAAAAASSVTELSTALARTHTLTRRP